VARPLHTTLKNGRDEAISKYGYTDEGTECYVFNFPVAYSGYEATQCYRLWSESQGDHFYTTSASGRDFAIANYGYVDESNLDKFYIFPPESN